MSQGPSEPGPTVSGGPGDDQDKPRLPAREQVTRPMERPVLPVHPPTEVVAPTSQPTEVAPTYQPTEVAPTAAPPHEPTTLNPRRQDVRSNPTVIAPQVRPNVDPWKQAASM